MTQQSLFGDLAGAASVDWVPDHAPFVRDSATSEAAADAIKPVSGKQRQTVYEFVKARGDEGATDEEIQAGTGISQNAERPRRRELETAGHIRDSGRTRPTASGRKAVVWVAVPRGAR